MRQNKLFSTLNNPPRFLMLEIDQVICLVAPLGFGMMLSGYAALISIAAGPLFLLVLGKIKKKANGIPLKSVGYWELPIDISKKVFLLKHFPESAEREYLL